MQSVPITINAVCLISAYVVVYSIRHHVIKFVSDLRQVGCFFRVIRFPPPVNNCWNWR